MRGENVDKRSSQQLGFRHRLFSDTQRHKNSRCCYILLL
jgi:hypothetical protein